MKTLRRTPAGRRRTVTAVLAATVVLGGAGAVSAVAFVGGDRGSRRATAGTPAGTHDRVDHGRTGGHDDSGGDALALGTGVGLKQAVDAATRSVAGTVTEVEPAGWRGEAVWKVDIVDAEGIEHEVTVKTTDGKAAAGRADRDEDADDHRDAALAESAGTSPSQAVDTALDKVPGIATSAELDDDHGRTAAWQIDVTDDQGAEHEVTVDAQTGKVTAAHSDRGRSSSKDADEDRADD